MSKKFVLIVVLLAGFVSGNVFGADDPVALTRAISLIVHDDFSVDEAIRTTKLKVE